MIVVVILGSDNEIHVYACHLATSSSVKQHKLRKRIAWLSDKEGIGKEFISLYIPPDSTFRQVIATLKNQSDSIADDPKSVQSRFKETFKNVIGHLKAKSEMPENGLGIFAGTFASENRSQVPVIEEIVPPEAVATYLFEVDDHFHLESLREMLRNPRVVGLLALDSKEASFGLLNGESLEFLEDITSGIPGKSRKGGQSQRRYERERDMELSNFFHRVAEHATRLFLEDRKVMALLVGGPGTTKADFLRGNYLHYELENALLSTVDTQSADKRGVNEILERSSEIIKNMCAPEERIAVHRLLAELSKQNGLASYGLDLVLDALKTGAVEVALVTDDTGLVEVTAMCRKCGLSKTEIMDEKRRVQKVRELISVRCERCGSTDYEVREKDIVDVLEDAASQTDARVEVISTKSDEKAQLSALGGIAAILRFSSK